MNTYVSIYLKIGGISNIFNIEYLFSYHEPMKSTFKNQEHPNHDKDAFFISMPLLIVLELLLL